MPLYRVAPYVVVGSNLWLVIFERRCHRESVPNTARCPVRRCHSLARTYLLDCNPSHQLRLQANPTPSSGGVKRLLPGKNVYCGRSQQNRRNCLPFEPRDSVTSRHTGKRYNGKMSPTPARLCDLQHGTRPMHAQAQRMCASGKTSCTTASPIPFN
jgi:hypothetical protein